MVFLFAYEYFSKNRKWHQQKLNQIKYTRVVNNQEKKYVLYHVFARGGGGGVDICAGGTRKKALLLDKSCKLILFSCAKSYVLLRFTQKINIIHLITFTYPYWSWGLFEQIADAWWYGFNLESLTITHERDGNLKFRVAGWSQDEYLFETNSLLKEISQN